MLETLASLDQYSLDNQVNNVLTQRGKQYVYDLTTCCHHSERAHLLHALMKGSFCS